MNWQGKRVFLTGHTGFKGGWLALWLTKLGAEVRGYSLSPSSTPSLFEVARIGSLVDDQRGDIRDEPSLIRALSDFNPEVVFHLAAQPLVRLSYADPIATFETNVMGTAHVLEAVRKVASVRAVVCVTTDKCYENNEWHWGYRESDPLGGYDPYSSSKACAEIVSAAYRRSFLAPAGVNVATARAGNVIGGGDWSTDRLLPDLVRGFLSGSPVGIRRPGAIRPWQHLLEPLNGYIILAEKLLGEHGSRYATAFNFGPADDDARTVGWIADRMVATWGSGRSWFQDGDCGVHEAGFLKLDASRARAELSWSPRLTLTVALDWLVQWYKAQAAGEDMQRFSLEQINRYQALSDDRTDDRFSNWQP
jgi:CDP-glucose 4,6-dehydratase